jgi:tetratricopeptide (TPR) repeat protein
MAPAEATGHTRARPGGAHLLLYGLLLVPPPAAAASQRPAPLVETQRVTAFDLLVELSRPDKPEQSVEPPADLSTADFTLLWEGAALPLVGLAPAGADREPWRLVVYVDRQLSSNHTVRWAAMELAERSARLARLGEVEIVVAEPEPRLALAPTRDAGLIDDSLSGLFLAPAGTTPLITRREDYLIAKADGVEGEAAAALARQAARDERMIVRRQTDRLLEWLVASDPPTSRRALLLVGDGWDLQPDLFYGAAAAALEREPDGGPAEEARRLAEALAAYGWVVAPLAPPPPPVGAGRFGLFVLPDITFPWAFAVKLRSLEVWLDGNRKPKRADALTELGHTLRRQGLLEEAVETYRKAIYHYYDHPKTARRQAKALVALGETLELQRDDAAARATLRAATVFDPTLAPRYPFAAARLLAPRQPLALLGRLTAGDTVATPAELDRLLRSLERRLRLTAQVPGVPDNELHRLDLRLQRTGFAARFPAVARWGTPPAVAELRLRRLLDGEAADGELEVTATLLEKPSTTGRRLELELPPAAEDDRSETGGEPSELLVSWASAGTGTAVQFRTRAISIPRTGRGTVSLDPPADHLWLALLIEDPAAGVWGGTSVELAGD